MKQLFSALALVLACATLALPRLATAQTSSAIPPAIITPDRLETSLGVLQFKDGAPSKETAAKVYDYLDLMRGVEAFVNAYQGASVAAAFKGFNDAGVPDNTALIWSELMDCSGPAACISTARFPEPLILSSEVTPYALAMASTSGNAACGARSVASTSGELDV